MSGCLNWMCVCVCVCSVVRACEFTCDVRVFEDLNRRQFTRKRWQCVIPALSVESSCARIILEQAAGQLQPEGQRWSCQLFNVLWTVWEQLAGLQGLSTSSKSPAGLPLYRIRFLWLPQPQRGVEVHSSSLQRALGRVCMSHILVHLSLHTPHCNSDRGTVKIHKENTTWKNSGGKYLSTFTQVLYVSTILRHLYFP